MLVNKEACCLQVNIKPGLYKSIPDPYYKCALTDVYTHSKQIMSTLLIHSICCNWNLKQQAKL